MNLVPRPILAALRASWFAVVALAVFSPTRAVAQPTTLKVFTTADGSAPVAPLAIRADGVMFGATSSGGANGLGTIYRVNADGSGYTVLKHFAEADGYNPTGGLLIASDGRLYGAATWGGMNNRGTLFRLEADGSNFTVLRALDSIADGQNPIAGLAEGPDGKLYGAASLGGPDWGTVFRLNTDGTGFTRLRSFGPGVGDANGTRPYGTPAFGPDGRIYGTTWTGGSAAGQGVIYRMNADGSNYSVIFTFTGSATGEQPYAGVRVAADGTLYGTTNFGGAYGGGVVYRVNPSGSGFIVVRHLNSNAEGNGPFYAVPALLAGRLFATAGFNGAGGAGSVISMSLTGADFKVENNFSGANGANPLSGVRVGPDGFLYGLARNGGGGAGTLFRLPFYTGDFSTATLDPFTLSVSQWTAGNTQFLHGTQPYWSVTSGGGQMKINLAPNNNDYLSDGPHVQTRSSFGLSGNFIATVTLDISANSGGSAGFFADFPGAYAGFGFSNGSIGFNTSVPNNNTQTPANLTAATFQLIRTGNTLTAQFKAVGAPAYTVLKSFTDPALAGKAVFDLTNYAGPGRTTGLSAAFSDFTITVPAASPAPVVSSSSASGGYGTAFTYTITATNSPTSFGASNLPAGLTFDATTGVIAGTLPGTPGSYIIGLSATNAGGTGTGTLTLDITDTTPPVITAPSLLTAEATGPTGAPITFTATATDAISGSATVTATPPSGSTFALGLSTVALSATDAAGNTATKGIVVNVTDTTPPALTLPANLLAEATGSSGAAVNFSASATDLVSGSVPVTLTPGSGSTFALGTTIVNALAKDGANNTATGSFTVTVRDTTPPVITSVTPSITSIWPPNKKMVPVTITVAATDAVGIASATIVSVATNQPDQKTQWQITGPLTVNLLADRNGDDKDRIYTITIAVRDAAGNAITKATTVTVPHDQGKAKEDGKEQKDGKDDHGEKGGKDDKAGKDN